MLFLPVMFTFLFATFPAGLVIYWTWNNILSITQQWVIMWRMGVANPAELKDRRRSCLMRRPAVS